MRKRPTTSDESGGTARRVTSVVRVPAWRGVGAVTGAALLLVLTATVAVLRTTGGATEVGPAEPKVFFAVRDGRTEIVEVATATGKVRRTLVDFGPADGTAQPSDVDPDISIETLDLAADRSSLFFGRFSLPERYAVYRLDLPDGRPVRVAAGRGPAVSPDGQRLAYTRDTAIVVSHLGSGEEQEFHNIFGVFGGVATSWSADSTAVAFEVEAADSVHPGVLDTVSGQVTELEPREGPSPGGYTAYSPVFRPSDGHVAVACCMSPDLSPDIPQDPPRLVLHDSKTGRETERWVLPFAVGPLDFDRSGTHLLVVGPDEQVLRRRDDRFVEVPGLTDVDVAVW